jgi:hypothetical protein
LESKLGYKGRQGVFLDTFSHIKLLLTQFLKIRKDPHEGSWVQLNLNFLTLEE